MIAVVATVTRHSTSSTVVATQPNSFVQFPKPFIYEQQSTLNKTVSCPQNENLKNVLHYDKFKCYVQQAPELLTQHSFVQRLLPGRQ
ncbi:hypothetical protein CEXT_106701 [Caerostris extrusa]|uniref:Uncharacterized protein n=1 Tax=Caerostris extrusa TaxID=172846 RepID=A0AAV4PG54_CAEEX|nr:hypothetical protein CEXT_106701 [Caerostris extrusa]